MWNPVDDREASLPWRGLASFLFHTPSSAMHPLIRAAPSILGPITAGPPLAGVKLVIPLPPFLAGHGARIEIGFEHGHLVVRLVRPGPAQPAWSDPSWSDPDDDLGPHDAWAQF